MGLHLPQYNYGGYDSVETLELLDGIVDIYMPDMKYCDEHTTEQLSGIKDYLKINRAAVTNMYRQVGHLEVDKQGVAYHDLLVRHLLLPNRLAGTHEVARFLAQEISTNTCLNIIAKCHSCHEAFDIPKIARAVDRQEFLQAIDLAHQQDLSRLDGDYFPLPLRCILR